MSLAWIGLREKLGKISITAFIHPRAPRHREFGAVEERWKALGEHVGNSEKRRGKGGDLRMTSLWEADGELAPKHRTRARCGCGPWSKSWSAVKKGRIEPKNTLLKISDLQMT